MDYSPYLDPNGYPGCRQTGDGTWDGGDTAAIMGTIMACSPEVTAQVIDRLKTDCPFDYVYYQPLRHPDTLVWYGQPNRYSRDQLTAMLCGLILSKRTCHSMFLSHRRRWFLTAWNSVENDGSKKSWPASLGDICGPEVWALWIRYFNPWWGFLFLWFFDIQTLIGAITWRWFTPQTMQLTRNQMLVTLTMIQRRPSITTIVVRKLTDWTAWIELWRLSNLATGEFPSADLFTEAVKRLPPA